MKRLLMALFLFALALPAQEKVETSKDSAKERLEAVQKQLRQFNQSVLHELLERAAKDPDPAVRRAIIDRLSRLRVSEVREMLEHQAASDADPNISLLALERLRQQQVQELGRLFEKRLALAREQKDEKSLAALAPHHQRWVTLARGAAMPEFLQTPPSVFDGVPSKSSVRAFAVGDIGAPGPDQRRVAGAALAQHRQKPFDFGLTLGDNFVPDGVTGLTDPRWTAEWEDIYSPLGIPVFASTGNHDWGFADSPAGEILYSRQSRSWRMPSLYYSFKAGPVQFFALATQAWSETQAAWLDRELARSTARWKVVYGHHGIYSYGTHGSTPELQKSLLPILKNRANIFLFGHEHIIQDLKDEDGVHFLNAPAGGQAARPARSGPMTVYSDSFWGFVSLDFDAERIRVEFFDTEGKVRYVKEIR